MGTLKAICFAVCFGVVSAFDWEIANKDAGCFGVSAFAPFFGSAESAVISDKGLAVCGLKFRDMKPIHDRFRDIHLVEFKGLVAESRNPTPFWKAVYQRVNSAIGARLGFGFSAVPCDL